MARKKGAKKYELVPVSPIERLAREIRRIKAAEVPPELRKSVSDLSEQVSKMVTVNINLQAKMTELMIKIADLVKELREIGDLLRRASEVEVEEGAAPAEISLTPVVEELKKISEQNERVVKAIEGLQDYLKRTYTRSLISRALGTSPLRKKYEEF